MERLGLSEKSGRRVGRQAERMASWGSMIVQREQMRRSAIEAV